MCSSALGSFSLIQEMSRKTPPCGLPRPALSSRLMQRATWSRVEQFRRTPRVLVALRVAPAFFRVVGGLLLVVLRDVAEHEPLAGAVAQDPAFAAHALGDEDALHARRPDHPRRMELHELHVDQRRAGAVGERMAVAGAFPAVAGDAVGAADAAGGEDHGLGAEEQEASALAFVPAGAGHAAIVGRQIDDGAFHVDGDAGVDGVILERADQLQARPIADMREAWIAVAAEVALQDAPIGGPVEDRAPRLELAHAIGRFPGVDLGHPPVVDVLAAAHRVGEVHLPAVAIVDVGQRRRDAAFGHHRVRLAEQRLADQADRHAGGRRLDGRAQPGAAGADHEDVVVVSRVGRHYSSLQSVQTPVAHSRT